MTPAELKAARLALGLSQNALARELGLSGGRHIRKIEDGQVAVSGPIAVALHYMLRDLQEGRREAS